MGFAALLLFMLAAPAVGKTLTLSGLGVDERLDEPPRFATIRAGLSTVPPVTVRLLVPRHLIETVPGEFTFEVLDERISGLAGSPVLISLEGMPSVAEQAKEWENYVHTVVQRYRGKVLGYVLGETEHAVASFDPATYVYLLKLASLQVRAVDSDAIVLEGNGRDRAPDEISSLYQNGLAPYVDGMALSASDADMNVLVAAVEERQPSSRIIVTGVQLGDEPQQVITRTLIAGLTNLASGVSLTTFGGGDAALREVVQMAGRLDETLPHRLVTIDEREMALKIDVGKLGAEAVHHILLFDPDTGATVVAYWATMAAIPRDTVEVALQSFLPDPPQLSDPGGSGKAQVEAFRYDAENHIATVRVPLLDRPLILVYPSAVSGATVTASVVPDVGEIIARHQQVQARVENLLRNYFASVRDEIHFRPTPVDSFDVIMERRFFTDRGSAEWEELSFSLNGARWGADRPAFPLLQPEKVLSLPLDLHLNEDYDYELVGQQKLGDQECYVVRFEPKSDSRSLYAGRVWIDQRNYQKLKVEVVQTHLSAPVVSNAEVSTYEKQGEVDGESLFLLTHVSDKQLLLIAGRNLLVEKETSFYDFQINSPAFEETRAAARDSDHIMLRDTDEGLRSFVKRGGKRVVSNELTMSAKALAIGTTVDPSFDFPLPIFGFNYLDFDFLHHDAQFALLFAGIFALGNIEKPNLLGGSFDAGLDFFGIAIPSNDVIFDKDGKVEEESLRTLPASLGINFGWQATAFQKLTFRYDLQYDHYASAETTAADFVPPQSTFTNEITLGYELRRAGYSFLTSGSYAHRVSWEPWGNVDAFDPDTQDYWKYRFIVGKDFFFKTFHKIHFDAGFFGGDRLDRFTKYQLGLFDETRVRGVPSTAVRFAELGLVQASYSFNVFDQFRFEVFYDRAWGNDPGQGLEWAGFSGLGVGLNLRGPRHTILRIDVGKSFLPEALRGAGSVVAQFLVLKPL